MINDWLGDDVLRTIPETVDGTCDAVFQDGFHEARDILARYRAPSDDLEREEQRAVLRAWSTMTGQKVRPGDAFLESESDNSGSRSDDARMTASHRPAPARRSNIPAEAKRPSKTGHTRVRVEIAAQSTRLDRGSHGLDPRILTWIRESNEPVSRTSTWRYVSGFPTPKERRESRSVTTWPDAGGRLRRGCCPYSPWTLAPRQPSARDSRCRHSSRWPSGMLGHVRVSGQSWGRFAVAQPASVTAGPLWTRQCNSRHREKHEL